MLRERRVFMQATRFLLLYHHLILSPHLHKAIEALALFTETDDFKTFREEYIRDRNDASILVDFKKQCLERVLQHHENKRVIRPLVDCIDRSKRLFRV